MFKLSMVYFYSFKTYVYPLSGSSELKLHFSFTSLFVVAYQYDIYILYIVFCVCKSTKLIMWTNTCVTKQYKRREGLTPAFFMVNRFWWFWEFCFRNYVNKVVNVFSRRIFPWPVIIYSDWKISTINCVCHVFFQRN